MPLEPIPHEVRFSRGFTLVELLVIIAIIGILSTIVIVSLSSVNSRGKDAAIQSNLDGVRTQAQLYYNDTGGYGSNAGLVNSTGDCTTGVAGTVFSDARVAKQVAAANFANGGGSMVCNVAVLGAAYAVYAELSSSPGSYYCVDSNGVGIKTTAVPGNNTSCL